MADFDQVRHYSLTSIGDLRETCSGIDQFNQCLTRINAIPWGRVVDFFGRATEYPVFLMNLTASDSTAVQRALFELSSAEHQQTISQATPLVAYFVNKLKPLIAKENVEHVDALMHRFAVALETPPNSTEFVGDVLFMTKEELLWPPFVSEDEDEYQMEIREIADDEYACWYNLTKSSVEAYFDSSQTG